MPSDITERDGERDIEKLRQQVAPVLHQDVFVYCTFPDRRMPASIEPICTFAEEEGLTAIISKSQAQQLELSSGPEWALITLTVHSSLEAVGLLAMVSRELAEHEIPCNVVSGYFHDHLFVPPSRAAEAMGALRALAMR